MRIPAQFPLIAALAVPRVAVSYAGYVAAPALMINWLSSRSYAKALIFLAFLVFSAFVNWALGLKFSFTAWGLELALFLPFMAAILAFTPSRFVNGRSFIRTLNLIVAISSFIVLLQMGFPLKLPYVHYLPDYWNGGFGRGGAKIVTMIGFFGVVEALSRKRAMTLRDNWSLIVAALNFLVPNFILGILAGGAALTIFARRNRALLFAGAAIAMILVPYLQYRAEQRNDAFAQAYGSNPKIYSFVIVGKLYAEQPHTALVGTGIGQFSSQPAIWTSPVNRYIGIHELPKLPGMFTSEVHERYLAPLMLRFREKSYAIESSANKPYSGITQLLAELGLPVTLLLLYCAYRTFWRGSGTDFGRAVFLFVMAINLLDPQVDSPWFGAMLFAALEAIRRDARVRALARADDASRESGLYFKPARPVAHQPAE
ncbi:hypothetical protein K3152_03135 [Qipengyuania sp. 1NDH17]|uniref:O-antigen ligase domain-containing protein n=1 Tax=Qipengyuania polymorpha TaxID=2867234 RepID=A0ABS7IUX5_9SPHN|nr:hypothetical protein [Qipengyuania polymorpha]MBX7457232.1 hypothetical protein [Qipengyuania polymorpha]